MKRILPIFCKDARHLWPYIAAFVTLLALATLFDPTYARGDRSQYYSLLSDLAAPLACFYLTIAAIYEEKLPGDRQYWLTRPFRWRDLLLAKLLFIAVFVNLPVLLCQSMVLSAMGISPLQHLSALLWRQVFFTSVYVLPAAAFASVTRHLGQIILGVLIAAAPNFLFQRWVFSWVFGSHGVEWLIATVMALLFTMGVALVLMTQYAKRRTGLSRLMLAATVLITFASVGVVPFGKLERFLTPQPTDIVQVAYQPGTARIVDWRQPRAGVLVNLPVTVTDLPANLRLFVNSTAVSIDVPGRPSSSWKPYASWTSDSAISIDVPKPLFTDIRDTPVDVRATVELTLFGNERTQPLPRGNSVTVPHIGSCTSRTAPRGTIEFICYSPSPRASLAVYSNTATTNWIVPRGTAEMHYPTAGDMQFLSRYTTQLPYSDWNELEGASLRTEEPLFHIQRTLTIRQLRLGDLVPAVKLWGEVTRRAE